MKILQFPVCEDRKCFNRYLKWSINRLRQRRTNKAFINSYTFQAIKKRLTYISLFDGLSRNQSFSQKKHKN